MNPVYLRLAFYSIAAIVAGAGLGDFDPTTGTLTMNLNDLAVALGGAGVLNLAVLHVWGKK